jgi:hypothetical protein
LSDSIVDSVRSFVAIAFNSRNPGVVISSSSFDSRPNGIALLSVAHSRGHATRSRAAGESWLQRREAF